MFQSGKNNELVTDLYIKATGTHQYLHATSLMYITLKNPCITVRHYAYDHSFYDQIDEVDIYSSLGPVFFIHSVDSQEKT